MENTMSRLLIEATVRQTLKSVQEDPKRSVRNLIDMALQFAEGRFQKDFFEVTHTMLENENSAYYALVQDAVAHIDTEHLVRFGMNLGYNSCTWGAERIRCSEEALGFNIPWTVLFSVDGKGAANQLKNYEKAIEEGERLGIYCWMFFCCGADPMDLLPLVQKHPDSVFFFFCPSEKVTDRLVEEASLLYNLMLVPRFDDSLDEACGRLREARLPYSVWTLYGREDAPHIESGEVFDTLQHLHPIFTALVPNPDCPPETRAAAYQAAVKMRNEQIYQTMPWDIYYDTCRLDQIISDDFCWVCFDEVGKLYFPGFGPKNPAGNLFGDGLAAVLRQTYPKLSKVCPC